MGFFDRKRENRQERTQDAMEHLQQRAADIGAKGALGGLRLGDMGSLMEIANEARAERGPMLAYGQRMQRLGLHGMPGSGTVQTVESFEIAALMGGDQVRITLTIEPEGGGAPFDAVAEQLLVAGQRDSLAPGARVAVRYDPDDPQTAMVLVGSGPAPMTMSTSVIISGGMTSFSTSSGGMAEFTMPQVGMPAPAPAAPAPAADDRISQLEQLAKLHSDGTLTDEEFTAAKRKLLDA